MKTTVEAAAAAMRRELGALITEAREQLGLDRRTVAARARCMASTVAGIENGWPVSLGYAQRIIDALGVDVADLVGGDPGPVPLSERVSLAMHEVWSLPVGAPALRRVGGELGASRVKAVARGSAGTMHDASVLAVAMGGWAAVLSSPDVPVVELAEVA